MNSNINFKTLWHAQQVQAPNVKNVYIKAYQFKRNSLCKLLLLNVLLIITFAFFGYIWYYFQPKLWTTKLGFVLVFIAMLLLVMFYNSTIPLLLKNRLDRNSKVYLQSLLKLRKKHLFLQTTVLGIYFLCMGLGVGFYMFEYVSKMALSWAVLAYVFITIWFGINWFYLRPKTVKKQQAKMNTIITELKALQEQFV